MPTIVVTIWGYVLAMFQVPMTYLGPIGTWTASMLEAERKSIVAAVSSPSVWLAMGTAAFFSFSLGFGIGEKGKSRMRTEAANYAAEVAAKDDQIKMLNHDVVIAKDQIKRLAGAKEAATAEAAHDAAPTPVATPKRKFVVRRPLAKSASAAPAWWPF